MICTKIMRDPDGQAVHLLGEVSFPDGVEDVVVVADGPRRIIIPAWASWDDFFEQPGIAMERGPQPSFDRGASTLLWPPADRLARGRRS